MRQRTMEWRQTTETMTPTDKTNPGDIEPSTTLLRRGDRTSFDRLYHRYAPQVLGFLMRLTQGNRSDAEDLAQETFLASYVAREGYAARGRPLAWLLGIAFRRWRDRQRSVKPATLPLSESLPAHREVEGQVVQRATLETALAQLEPPFREVLLLIGGQQLSYKEAAEITGEPVGTVKWRFHEATRKMRQLMQNDELAALAQTSTATKPTSRTDTDRRESGQLPHPRGVGLAAKSLGDLRQ